MLTTFIEKKIKEFDEIFFDMEVWVYYGGSLPRKSGDITAKVIDGKKEVKSFLKSALQEVYQQALKDVRERLPKKNMPYGFIEGKDRRSELKKHWQVGKNQDLTEISEIINKLKKI